MSETAEREDRALLLSLYIDGELEDRRKAEVEEKLRTDPAWRQDFESLRAADERVTKAVRTNWHDEEFTTKVRQRLQGVPQPTERGIPAADVSAGAAGGEATSPKPGRFGTVVLYLGLLFVGLLLAAWLVKKLFF